MSHRPLLALGATSLLALLICAAPAKAQPVPSAAQPSPTAPVPLPAPNATPPGPGTAPPGGTWGAGLPGAPPPYPTTPTPGYGPGAVPPGSAPLVPTPPANTAPPANGAPPNGAAPNGAAPQSPYPQSAYQPGSLWLSATNDPMLLGPDGMLHQLPLEMPYDPEKGVPPGYKLFEKPRKKLAITGGSILAGLWLVSAVVGGFMEDDAQRQNSYNTSNTQYGYGYYDPNYKERHAWPMFFPVVGPFITAGTDHTDGGVTAILIIDGLAQAAMGTMFIVGMVTTEKVLKFQFQGSEVALHPMAAPTTGGGFAGLQASF